jgi:GT2 family glycosyltransferase
MQQGYRWLLRRSPDNDDLVLLANDDIEFEQDFLARAVDCLRRVPHALLAARLRHPQTGAALETGVYADMRRFTFRAAEAAQEINCLPTRALLVRWADMRRLGEFHPRLLPHYWADYEYTMRARSLGMQCITTADVLISANPQTTGFHDLDNLVGWKFLRQLFSIKTPLNPVYRTSFVLLASPWSWKAVNVANVWVRAGFRILWQGVLHRRFPRQALPTASA